MHLKNDNNLVEVIHKNTCLWRFKEPNIYCYNFGELPSSAPMNHNIECLLVYTSVLSQES